MHDTLLLIVDVQNAIAVNKPYRFDEVLSNIKLLLTKFRTGKKPLLFIQHDDGIGSDFEVNTHGWKFVDEIAPQAGEMVIPKLFNSAFRGTPLDEYLKKSGIKKLIIVGLQTEYCIDTTIRVAFEKGYEVIIPELTNTTVDGPVLKAEDIVKHHHHLFDNRFGRVVKMEDLLTAE